MSLSDLMSKSDSVQCQKKKKKKKSGLNEITTFKTEYTLGDFGQSQVKDDQRERNRMVIFGCGFKTVVLYHIVREVHRWSLSLACD